MTSWRQFQTRRLTGYSLWLQGPLCVAEVIKAAKHPSSAKLKVCTVSDGADVHQVGDAALTAAVNYGMLENIRA